MSTIKELVDQYGLPLFVKKPIWYGTYCFKAEKLNTNDTVSGWIFNNGSQKEAKTFRGSEEMVLFQDAPQPKAKITDDISVYDEENRNLQRIEERIDELVDSEWRLYAPYEEEIKSFVVYDREDRERIQALRSLAEPHMHRANEYRSYKPCPYFMRVDIDIDHGDEIQCFIGKKGLAGEHGIIIHDWQSPVANAARFARAQRFQADGHECNLYLRRAIDIKDERIELVNTQFEINTVTLDGTVIDPFLLSVLRDKRRDYKLTDIIRTIQYNQNEIISKPLQQSFILQGCAGSGKTMILLHRLSYLLYNHRNIDVSNYCILTPNEYFNRHIDDLSRELEIDRIKRYTVEGFYRQLIERLTAEDYDSNQEGSGWVRIPKIKMPSGEVRSEKGLHDAMLNEIYSLKYQDEMRRLYEKAWMDFAAAVGQCDLGKYRDMTTTEFPSLTNHTYDTYRRVRAFHAELLAVVTKQENEIKEAKEGLHRMDQTLPEYRRRLAVAERSMTETKDTIRVRLTEELSNVKQRCAGAETRLKSLVSEVDDLQVKRRTVEEVTSDAFAEQEVLMTTEERTSYAYVSEAQTPYAAHVREKCGDRIAEISKAQSQLASVPFYNFGKKASVRRWIEELTVAFQSEVKTIMDDYQRMMSPKIQEARSSLRAIDEALESKKQTMREELLGQQRDQNTIPILEEALTLVEAEQVSSVKHLIGVPAYGFVRTDLMRLEKCLDDIAAMSKAIQAQTDKAEEYRKALRKSESNGLGEEFKKAVHDFESAMNLIDAKNLYGQFMDSLKIIYDKYNCPYREREQYRHRLYVTLCMCTLYYRDKRNPEKHVSIDEAQDIAVSEYRLLKGVLGSGVTFNLYGDVNQLVYTYKGISQWEDLSQTISDQIYFLNENYRNSIQITEYCNKAFEAEVVAIGLKGENVMEGSLEEVVCDLQNYRRKNSRGRTAIIYKKGMERLAEKARELLDEHEYAWDQIDSERISIITVEMAKGLEFEKVVVIADQMSINEKYISYTRALESLAVTACS